MKTRFFLMMLLAVALFSCQKEKTDPATTQDVSFQAMKIDPGAGLKNTADWECVTNVPTHAWIVINGINYYPELFTLDGFLYTQAIKLPVGGYSITTFILFDDVNNNNIYDMLIDVIVYGTPMSTSTYAQYVNWPLAYSFNVQAFKKIEIPIEVLCFMEKDKIPFGYFWFNITEIVIREQCFFGDICLKDLDDYAGSLYAGQLHGLQIDMPAIFKLKLTYLDGAVTKEVWFSNETWLGEGAPLCIQYPDNLSLANELFTVDLWIYVATGPTFGYVKFHTWTFIDDAMLGAGADGVVDFVLGNCNLTDPDLQLAPYMDLPAQCGLTTGSVVPSVSQIQGHSGYFDVTLSGIGAGYDITDQMYAINCFNRGVTINLGTYYFMNVYSSLYPQFMQGPCAGLDWDKANYLINHLDDFPGYVWSDIQQAFWKIEDNTWTMAANASVPAGGVIAQAMWAAADANGDGYVPLPGGWAGVAFEHATLPVVQCIFLRVDP